MWVSLAENRFVLASGKPAWRRSSSRCERGFCAECGSALFMKYDGEAEIAISLGSLDHPQVFEPDYSIWCSERLSFVAAVSGNRPQFARDPEIALNAQTRAGTKPT